MTATAHWRDRIADELVVDRGALALIGVFLLVQILTVALVLRFQAIEYAAQGPAGVDGNDASTGALWVGAEVLWALFLVGLIMLWKRLPEWLREKITLAVSVFVVMVLGAVAQASGGFWAWAAIAVGGVFSLSVLDELGFYWIVNNIAVVGLSALIAAVVATFIGLPALIIALVGLAVYDYWFADRMTWMFDLAAAAMRLWLPMIFLWPSGWRVDWDEFVDSVADNEPTEQIDWAIGTGDLTLAAIFTGVVAYRGDLLAMNETLVAVAGVMAGIVLACLRIRQKMLTRDGGAGMPPLAAGALGGYAVVAIPMVVLSL